MFKIFTNIAVISILVLGIFIISCEDNDGSIDPIVSEGFPCENENRGDVNLDGLPFTIADAVFYVNYFVYGLEALGPDFQTAAENSDINGDGQVLTVSDLVLLIGVIIGEESPFCPKNLELKQVEYWVENSVLSVGDELGALYIELDRVADVHLLAEGIEMKSNNNRVILYSLEHNSFSGQILRFDANIVKIEAATDEGNPVVWKMYERPQLLQNYPNPFTETTKITFCFREALDYTLTIYNVNGRVVDVYSGSAEPGCCEIEWDGKNYPPGVYFYKLKAGDFSETKKMLLL